VYIGTSLFNFYVCQHTGQCRNWAFQNLFINFNFVHGFHVYQYYIFLLYEMLISVPVRYCTHGTWHVKWRIIACNICNRSDWMMACVTMTSINKNCFNFMAHVLHTVIIKSFWHHLIYNLHKSIQSKCILNSI
jgi:hypothetical protein